MPAVVGERLDVAYSDLEAGGVVKGDVEIVGGGTFGVVTEENWTVCEQRPDPGSTDLTGVRLVVDRKCPKMVAEFTAPAESPTPMESADTVASDAASPSASASSGVTDAESAAAEPSDEPDSPVYFSASARGDLKDLYKDLSDTRNAVNEGSIIRLIGNSIELSFNMGQLGALTPPMNIGDDWDREFRQLERAVDAVTSAISNGASVGRMKGLIATAQNQVKVLLGIVRELA